MIRIDMICYHEIWYDTKKIDAVMVFISDTHTKERGSQKTKKKEEEISKVKINSRNTVNDSI